MKQLTTFCLIFVSSVISKNNIPYFHPNLPVGPFKVYPKTIIKCNPMETHVIMFDLFLNKLSHNVTEIKGNITVMKPFQDSYDFSYRMDVKDSTGGWRDNAFIYKGHKACSTNKQLFGTSMPMVKTDKRYNGGCPVSPGIYYVQGFDVTHTVESSNFPKQFFYGMYKFQYELYDNKKNQVACYCGVVQLKRPWEEE